MSFLSRLVLILFNVQFCNSLSLDDSQTLVHILTSEALLNHGQKFQTCIVNGADGVQTSDALLNLTVAIEKSPQFVDNLHGTSIMYREKVTYKCDSYVIVMSDSEPSRLENVMENLEFAKCWDANSYFVLLAEEVSFQNINFQHFMESFVQKILKFGIVRSLFVHHNVEDGGLKIMISNYYAQTFSTFVDMNSTRKFIARDPLQDVNGYPFKSAYAISVPYLIWDGFKLNGP